MADSETKPEPRHDEASGDGKETRFYPLDATDLPFARYEHSGLTERDLMVHNIMACYMNPSRPKPSEHRRYATCPYATCDDIQHDINVIRTSLFTFGDCKLPDYFSSHSSSYFPVSLQGSSSLCPPSTEIFLDSVMRHYLEIDDSAMRAWIADTGHRLVPRPPLKRRRVDRRSLDVDSQIWESFVTAEQAQLVQYRSLVENQADARLYSGGMFAPTIRRGLDEFDIGVHGASRLPSFTLNDLDTFPRSWDSAPVWPEGEKWSRYMLIPVHQHRSSLRSHLWRPDDCIKDFNIHPGRGRNRDGHWSTARTSCSTTADGRYGRERRRCSSLPPEGSFASAILPASLDDARRGDLTLIFSRMKVSQLDRRSRRRSLSRTRIEELFDWDVKIPNPRGQRPPEPGPRCHNCVLPGHQHTDCPWPCGHCGTTSRKYYEFFRRELGKVSVKDFLDVKPHAAPDCPVSPKNRCKCIAFPTYHTAKDCRITCHRDCGNPAVPGSLRHRSAMLCKSRCCMCGIRGHNGKECTNKTCRCGGHHLGQDCCWNPTCRVKGCDRYLCGVHCRECGSVEGRPFKDRRCWRCHGADGPFDWTKHRPRRTKKDPEQPGPVGRGEHVAEPLAEKENTTEQSVTIMPPPKIEPVTTVPKNTIFNNSGWSFSGITNGESSRI